MRVSIILIGLGLMLGAVLIGGAVQAQTNDHLKCYQVKGDLKLKGFVDIETPQFGLVVSGKPDLLAISGKTVEVCDCKTGQPRGSDGVQIMIYMYCIPRSKPELREKTFKGQIVYADHRVDIPPSAINKEFEKNFGYFLDILDSDEPANKVPSAREWEFCDIGKADCPERIDAPVEEE